MRDIVGAGLAPALLMKNHPDKGKPGKGNRKGLPLQRCHDFVFII
jgi:hypothetical protein